MILSLGAAECGLNLLHDILARQRYAHSTINQAPLLSWEAADKRRRITERLARMRKHSQAKYLADAGYFYLPYVEEAIAYESELRVVVLQRPMEEAISAYCQRLEQIYPYPVDHWSVSPESPWQQDFMHSRCFPKYDVYSRFEGLCQYWEAYRNEVDRLVSKYPRNVRLWDTSALTTETGVSEVLDFVGIEPQDQVIVTGTKTNTEVWSPERINAPKPARFPHRMDPRRCVILVPYQGLIQSDCEKGLKELENRGYTVRRVQGYAAIDQGRNQMATDALNDGFDETIWIDSDIGFHPDSIEKLRSHPQWVVCGIYPQKNKRALASHIMPGTKSITFGRGGGLTEILYAGTGFLMIRREAYWKIFNDLQLPVCNERFGRTMIPFFQPMVREIEEAHWYLAEDFAFGERARRCNIAIYADTSLRLWHVGNYRYGWEDAGIERPRYGSFTMHFDKQEEEKVVSRVEDRLASFSADHPWPKECPKAELSELPEIPTPDLTQLLSNHLNSHTRLILEIGPGSGQLTRLLAKHPSGAAVIALEDWPREEREDGALPPTTSVAFDNFLSECWETRHRITPVSRDYSRGLQEIADAQLRPDVVIVNDNHQRQLTKELLLMICEYFPGIPVIGNRFDEDRISDTLKQVSRDQKLQFKPLDTAWLLHV